MGLRTRARRMRKHRTCKEPNYLGGKRDAEKNHAQEK